MATALSELLHVTVLFVALSGFTVAVSVSDSPSVRASSVLSSSTEVTATAFFLTVMAQVAVFPPAFAVMTALPSFSAVTFPFSTVATALSELLHVTVLSVALSGFTVALNESVPPTAISDVEEFNDTDATGIFSGTFSS